MVGAHQQLAISKTYVASDQTVCESGVCVKQASLVRACLVLIVTL